MVFVLGGFWLLEEEKDSSVETMDRVTDNNIFRQAKQLLNEKPVLEMNAEELEVVNIATMPLLLLHHFSDRSINDGLEELAKMVEEE